MSFIWKFTRFGLIFVAAFLISLLAPSLKSNTTTSLEAALANQGQAQTSLVRSSFYQLPGVERVTTAVDCEDTTCPTGQPAGLDKCVERTKFCVYYTTASITETEAIWAADTIQSYWDRFVALGFNQPKYSTKLRVELTDVGGCNGGTGWDSNAMDTFAGCFDVTLLAKKVLGHELTHRMQYAYDTSAGAPIQTKFLKEGTARATEDNWFTEIDHWAAALSYSSFNTEANNYLLSVHNDITSFDMRYMSCLWWKYGMEQYGTITTEPQRGIDFVKQVLLQNTAGYNGVAAVNRALSAMGTGTNFNESFKQFAVAIYTKDLSGLPNSSYNFLDEDEAGNPGTYGPLVPNAGGTIQVGTSANWNNQSINRYGLRYYQANIGANCPVISASFHRDDAGPAFYHIITQNGTAFNSHVRGSGADWTQAFIDEDVTKITAIAGSLENTSLVDVSLTCANPVVEIKMPNSDAVARVQTDTRFLAQVLVTNGSSTGPVVAGLTNDYFRAEVNGVVADVVGGGYIQEQYWLLIQAPSLSDGVYDLEISLQEPGGAILDSDTNPNSVIYTTSLSDQVLIIDRSGSMSMGTPQRILAAKDAAAFYVDVTRDNDGLAVVPYNGDVAPPPYDLRRVNNTVRAAAKTYINALTASGMTSIGDGLKEAINQIKSSETGNELCSLVLLSDGMENTAAFWADVRSEVIDSGCPVTAIAFGPETDEILMQTIAEETGGLYFYNDVYVSTSLESLSPEAIPSDMALDLGNTYEYAESLAEFRQRLLAEKGVVSEKEPEDVYHVLVDETISEIVFSLDWPKASYGNLDLYLLDPDGNKYTPTDPGYAFEDDNNSHLGYRLTKIVPGRWEITVKYNKSELGEVPYQVLVSARSMINFELLLPDRLGLAFTTGGRVPIYAILSGKGPIPDAEVRAWVTSPNGAKVLVPLLDDGQHDDGASGDGLYAGIYTAVNQAVAVEPTGEDDQSIPNDEGSYRVLAQAFHKEFQREAIGAFSVLEGVDVNKNRLPDIWEKINNVTDPGDDPDRDNLINSQEYIHGTDPNDPDSDDGGENDGSEVIHTRDPLEPSDDQIAAPDFLQVQPWYKSVILHFDVKSNYDFLRLYRSEQPDGKWEEVEVITEPFGVYTDTLVTSGSEYKYQILAGFNPVTIDSGPLPNQVNAAEVLSALLTSEGVTPSDDPLLPEAHVLINQDDPTTFNPNVTLTFIPYEDEGTESLAAFEDITEVMISNRPDFLGSSWQAFQQGIPWMIDVNWGEIATVYVRFRDRSGQVSIGPESDSILYQGFTAFLPVINR